MFCRRYALERADVGVFGVVDDDAGPLCGVHRGAAANGDHVVSSGRFEGRNAVLHVLDRRVLFEAVKYLIGKSRLFEDVKHSLRHAEFYQVLVRHDEGLFKSAARGLFGDAFDRSGAEIRRSVPYHAVCHFTSLLF